MSSSASRSMKRASLALLLVAVVAGLFSFAPVRSAASEFLSWFRIRKFTGVTVDPAALRNLAGSEVKLNELLSSSVRVLRAPEPGKSVATVAEAGEALGYAPRMPAILSGPSSLRVENGGEMEFTVDLPKVDQLFELAGRSDLALPRDLDGAVVHATLFPSLHATWKTHSRETALFQTITPEVRIPEGLDFRPATRAFLELLGASAEDAERLSQAIDWSTTFVVPIPAGAASFGEVDVDGAPGLLVRVNDPKPESAEREHRHRHGGGYLLLWAREEMVFGLFGPHDPWYLLEIARSVR